MSKKQICAGRHLVANTVPCRLSKCLRRPDFLAGSCVVPAKAACSSHRMHTPPDHDIILHDCRLARNGAEAVSVAKYLVVMFFFILIDGYLNCDAHKAVRS